MRLYKDHEKEDGYAQNSSMSTTSWYISFLWFLYLQSCVYALPATSPPEPSEIAPHVSVSGSLNRRLPPNRFKLNNITYSVELIPRDERGHFSDSYKITGGYQVGNKHIPAILKRVAEKKAEGEDSKTRKEIEFLRKDSVDLYLYHQWSKTQDDSGNYGVSIVVKDVGGLDPPFRPYYKWYKEDETMNAVDSLRNVRENIEERLRWFREEKNLLYSDIKPENIFLRKAATQPLGMKREINSSVQVMPIDWGPEDYYAGVTDISFLAKGTEARSKKLVKHAAHVRKSLELSFSVEALYVNLKSHGLELRKQDIVDKEFKGKTYNVLPIIEATPQDHIKTYVIIGGFKTARHALMRIITTEGKKGDGEDAIQEMKMRGLLLDSKLESDEACLIYIDTRKLQ